MDDNEKKLVFNRPLNTKKVKINSIPDPGNLNGYIVEEGRSIKGGKLKKGARTSRSAIVYNWGGQELGTDDDYTNY